MLQIALPNKGALSSVSIELITSAGYKCKREGRELTVIDKENNIEFVYLRPRDIAIYVSKGILDLGITGRDLAIDSGSELEELLELGIGKSRFFYALPKDSDLVPDKFNGIRIATSYPNIVMADLARRGAKAEIVRLDGAVEISIQLGVADAIADVVESGKTLIAAGLKTVGDAIMSSEACVMSRSRDMQAKDEVQLFIKRLNGIIVAREYGVIEYDVEKSKVEQACRITPGIESPTISPLSKEGWVAVKAMFKKKQVNKIIDQLVDIDAKGIIVTDIKTCRI
jgi:ATP phosphoribosyltransferase